MKLKWFLNVVVFIIVFYVAFFAGNILERVKEDDDLKASLAHADKQYTKLRTIKKEKLTLSQKDSINRLEYWWLGYKQAIMTERKRILTRSQ